MHLLRLFRLACCLIVLIFLQACASNPPTPLPTPSLPAQAATLTLSALLREPQRWSGQRVTLITTVAQDRSQVLTLSNDTPVTPKAAIWLAQPLPETVQQQIANQGRVLKLRGVLGPPGAYGAEQQYTYQFSAERVEAIAPEPTTIVNLADNPRALDRMLLRVEGTLLVQQNSALLVDKVSAGGIPAADARLIKLPSPPADAPWISRLKQSGDVQWGAVRMIGWWQDAQLTPLSTEVITQP